MENLFLAITHNQENDFYDSELYYDNIYGWRQYFSDTFSPNIETVEVIEFKVTGKTYNERKNSVVEIAKEYQCLDSPLYMSQCAEIYSWLEDKARKYGLIREFKENAII